MTRNRAIDLKNFTVPAAAAGELGNNLNLQVELQVASLSDSLSQWTSRLSQCRHARRGPVNAGPPGRVELTQRLAGGPDEIGLDSESRLG